MNKLDASEEFQEILGENQFKTLEQLFKEENIEFITDLSDKEIRNIAIILFLADYLEMPEFRVFVINVMKLKVSKNRKGRGEFLTGFTEIKRKLDEELKQNKSIM